MNLKDLVNEISIKTSLPASDVKKVVSQTFQTLSDLIDRDEKFLSSILTMSVQNLPEISGREGKPDRPAIKVGRLRKRLQDS